MKAIGILNPGPESVLCIEERPIPAPGRGEILIKVAAIGVNRGDLLQREGHYPPPQGASDLPGLEVAGEVVTLGPETQAFTPGDRVCALLPAGGYAEYVTAPSGLCFTVPTHLDFAEAASLPEALFTVWDNVFIRGRLSPGETFLIQGGTSGIGMVAIPLALEFGAKVIATAGSDEKCQALRNAGAHAINYKKEDFKIRALELTEGQGVDVILDLVGGPYLTSHISLLKTEGRLVLIAVQGGYRSDLNLLSILSKRLTLTGSTLRSRPLEQKIALAEAIRETVWPLITSGKIRPCIGRRFAFHQAEEAHALMRSSQHIGKIILETAA